MSDLCTPWCLHVVATLQIAERIAAGTDEIGEIARAAGCDPDCLHAVMGHLIDKGVFEETEPGRFALNEVSQGLLDPMVRLGLDLNGIGGRMARVWGSMLGYVRTGRSAYPEVFGCSFWDDLDAHPEIAASFDALIGPPGHGDPNPDFEIEGGWETVQSVVDVGGGTGALLAGVLRIHPYLRGTLVDLPRTVAQAGEIFAQAGVSDRASVAGRSFFDLLPAGAGIYLLRGVLNNWPDPEALALLRGCAEAARPDGRIAILKSVVPDGTPPRLSVDMLLTGGKTRTLSEFRRLAGEAGLEVVSAGRQPSGYYVVECRPAVL
jgi:SAM-dependent methyltransferase